ncbi:MAG TPA: TolC family protein [Rhodothermales bacterium]|nr:TolC family protein [Rhodothermales bacterium]
MSLILFVALLSVPPDTLDLDLCYREAVARYPLRGEIDLQSRVEDSRISALQSNYLPQLTLRGDATYQSEVPDFADFPAAFAPPVISHDQYHITLGAEQLIYDGGRIASEKAVAAAEAAEARQQVEVSLYELRDRVNQAYFGALLLQARLSTLAALHDDIRARLEIVDAQVTNGVLLQSNADVLRVELIAVEQQQIGSEKQRLASLGVLGGLIGQDLDPSTHLQVPARTSSGAASDAARRPEYTLFSRAKSTLASRIGQTARSNYPNVAAFGDASYGRIPGLNMFENDLTPYYAFGLRMSWKLWDWKSNQRRHQALRLQQEIVDVREATFAKNIDLALQRQVRDVERLEELIQRDDEIIALRKRIVEQTESQLENGVITATEYLLERNAAYRAELTREQHAIQLAQAHAQILTTIGEE